MYTDVKMHRDQTLKNGDSSLVQVLGMGIIYEHYSVSLELGTAALVSHSMRISMYRRVQAGYRMTLELQYCI
jgi:hypothetical protein